MVSWWRDDRIHCTFKNIVFTIKSDYLPIISLTPCSPDIGASFRMEITLFTSSIQAKAGTEHDILFIQSGYIKIVTTTSRPS